MNCCVPFCKSSKKYITRKYDSVNEINFHNFPNDYDLKEKWLKAIRGEGRDEYFTWQGSNRWNYYVCSLHFKADDFTPCKTHKHLVPGSVPSIFTQHPQSTSQKEISIERIQTSKPENNPPVLPIKKKTFKPEQCKVTGESVMCADAKNGKTSNIDNRGKNSNVNDGIENSSVQISAVNTSVANNAVTSEIEQNCSVSAKTITVNNSNQPIFNVNPLVNANAIGNTNLLYVGNFEISNSDKKFKNFKVFQCTINPPDANVINVDKPSNNVDMHQTHDEPLPRSDRGTFSTETGDKQNDSATRSEVSVQDIMKSVFSNTKICNLLLKNNTTPVNDTVNTKRNYYNELNPNNNSNEDCIPNLNTIDSHLNASQSNSNNQSDKNDCTANLRSHLMLNSNNNENSDGDCTTNLNNYNSSLNVPPNDISTLPNEQRMSDIEKWRAATRDQIADLSRSNDILRRHISKQKETLKKRQPKLKTRNEMINKYNIEAMEEGIENKDGKSLFLCDQLRSITREQILWSEKSLEFMRQLVRKFPESYDFLKEEDVMYLPNPRILGCKKVRKS